MNDYQAEAMSFRLPTAGFNYALVNLSGEVGELHSLVAKGWRDGYQTDFQLNFKKELGDILWHVAALAMDQGFTLEEIAQSNLSKLNSRKSNNTLQGSGDNR